jgi:hypothetical protein
LTINEEETDAIFCSFSRAHIHDLQAEKIIWPFDVPVPGTLHHPQVILDRPRQGHDKQGPRDAKALQLLGNSERGSGHGIRSSFCFKTQKLLTKCIGRPGHRGKVEGRGVQNHASETFTSAARYHSDSYPYAVESHHTDAVDDPPQLSTYPTPCPPGATLRTYLHPNAPPDA